MSKDSAILLSTRRDFLGLMAGAGLAAALPRWAAAETAASGRKPNVVVILTDDLGYRDLGCFGATDIQTPHLDKMAAEGTRFTSFYCGATVCTPARAGLMTGCYAKRVGLHVGVLGAGSKTGLNPDEITIADLLRQQGYRTACIGKWHLGLLPEFLPTRQGFDSYYGCPHANHGVLAGRSDQPVFYRDDKPVEPPEMSELTVKYTEEAVRLIQANKDKPFFLYLAHNAPHVPLYASKEFRGKSKAGLYGDMIEEIDWSCGQVLKALKDAGIDRQTLVIFISDNGPAGRSAVPLHGAKGSSWEGGTRVPCIMRYPGVVPAGRECGEMAMMMDILPTAAGLAGTKAPADRIIDGKDIRPLMLGEKDATSPHSEYYCYGRDGKLCSVRSGRWKLHLLEPSEKWWGKMPADGQKLLDTKPKDPLPWLHDLQTDLAETKNLAAEHPDIVERLKKLASDFDAGITRDARPVGQAKTG